MEVVCTEFENQYNSIVDRAYQKDPGSIANLYGYKQLSQHKYLILILVIAQVRRDSMFILCTN